MPAIKTDHFYIRALQRGITKKEIRCIQRVGSWELQADHSWKVYWQDLLVIVTSTFECQTVYRTGKMYEPKVVIDNTNIISLDMYRKLSEFDTTELRDHHPDDEYEMDYDDYMKRGRKVS